MAKRCKGLNSKCFLFTYLIIVGFMLVLWMNKLPLMQEETRDIPASLEKVVVSPTINLDNFSLTTKGKLALTNEWLADKWTFVAFSYGHCLPNCQNQLAVMAQVKKALANTDVQFLVVSIDSEHESASQLADFLEQQSNDAVAVVGESNVIEQLARSFNALFLQTDYADGSYMIEQEYNLFLVDPKGRVYASFAPPYTSQMISEYFFKLRRFYAKSESE